MTTDLKGSEVQRVWYGLGWQALTTMSHLMHNELRQHDSADDAAAHIDRCLATIDEIGGDAALKRTCRAMFVTVCEIAPAAFPAPGTVSSVQVCAIDPEGAPVDLTDQGPQASMAPQVVSALIAHDQDQLTALMDAARAMGVAYRLAGNALFLVTLQAAQHGVLIDDPQGVFRDHCPGCTVAVGTRHTHHCVVARCRHTGLAYLTCHAGHATACERDVWDGHWPGTIDCIEHEMWTRWDYERGPVPCSGDHPEAAPDYDRLARTHTWSVEAQRWVVPEATETSPDGT